jgi:hypothetical protein
MKRDREDPPTLWEKRYRSLPRIWTRAHKVQTLKYQVRNRRRPAREAAA